MPNMLQAALPAQPTSGQTKYVCPAAFLKDRDLLQQYLEQNKEPFLEELFNVLAVQFHALVSTMPDTEFSSVPVGHNLASVKENLTKYMIVKLYKQLHQKVTEFCREYQSQLPKITLLEFVQAMTQIVGTYSVLDLKNMIKYELINKTDNASPEITVRTTAFFKHVREKFEDYFIMWLFQNYTEDFQRIMENIIVKDLPKDPQSATAPTIAESSRGYVPQCSWPQEQQQLLQNDFAARGTLFFQSLFNVLAHHIDDVIAQSLHPAFSSDLVRDEYRQKLMICLYEAVINKITPLFINPQTKADVVRCMTLAVQQMTREDFQSFVPVERMFDLDVQQDPKSLQFKEFEMRVVRDFQQKREKLCEPVQSKPSVVCKSSTLHNWDCPESWHEDKVRFKSNLNQAGKVFFPNLFDIFACLIEALMAQVPDILFSVDGSHDAQQIEKNKFKLSRTLFKDLYFWVYSDFMVVSKILGYKELFENSLKNIPFKQLSKLIVFERKCLPNNQEQVSFNYGLFSEQIRLNFEQEVALAKKSQSSIRNVFKVPPRAAPQPFADTKTVKKIYDDQKRKFVQLKIDFHNGLYQVIAEKLRKLTEIMPDECFYPFKNNELTPIKQNEVKVKRLEFYNRAVSLIHQSLSCHVMERYRDDNKQLNKRLNPLDLDSYFEAQALSIRNISEKNLYDSLQMMTFEESESGLDGQIKEQSKNDFEKYLQEKFDTLQKIKKQQEEKRLKQEQIAMQRLEDLKLEETGQREMCEEELNLKQQSLLTQENFENFVQQKKMEQVVEELVKEQVDKAKDEQLRIEKLAAELLLEQRNELTIKNMKATIGNMETLCLGYVAGLDSFDQEFAIFQKKWSIARLIQRYMQQKMSERYRVANIEKEIKEKKEASFKEIMKRNQSYTTLAQNQKVQNEENEKKLQARHEAYLKQSSLEWKSMMLGLQEKKEAFDNDFEKWQKAIVLVQKLLRQKQTDQHTANCAQSFQVWKSNVSKFLTEHKDNTNAVLDEFESEVQKDIDKNFKKFTALSVLQRFGQGALSRQLLAQQRLQKQQLNAQAQPSNLRTNDPYAQVVDPALFIESPVELPVAPAPAQIQSKYFYWTDANGQQFSQELQQEQQLNVQAQPSNSRTNNPYAQVAATPVSLQQAQANGWRISTEEELQNILKLNKWIEEINEWREQNKVRRVVKNDRL
jgi:hypothetical protein